MHHRAEHGLREATVKVTVEARDARDHEARGKVFSDVGISAHAERAAAVVGETALACERERIDDEVLSLTLLIAHPGTKVATGVPVSRQTPWLRNVDAEIRVIPVAAQSGLRIK